MPTDLHDLAAALVRMGCPPNKSVELAAQLDKRAQQLAAQKSRTYEDALAHLLKLLGQGWVARDINP